MASNKPTSLVAYPPSSDLLQALGISQQQYSQLLPAARTQIEYLQGLIGQLDTQDYDAALSTIQGQAGAIWQGDPFSMGSPLQDESDAAQSLNSLVTSLQSKIPQGYVHPPNTQNLQQSAQAAEQAAANPQNAQPITGLGNVSGAAGQTTYDYQQLQSLMGTDPQTAYQSAVASLQKANQNLKSGQKPSSIPTEAQWYEQQLSNMQTPFQPLMQSLNAEYITAQGTSMPVQLQQQIIAQIQQMRTSAPDDYNELVSGMANLKTNIQTLEKQPTNQSLANIGTALASLGFSSTGQLSSLYSSFNEYINAVETPYYQQNEIDAQNIAAFRSQLGVAPTADQIAQMQGMNAEELNNYVQSQPSPIQGVQAGQYQSVLKQMETLWQQYFHRQPTSTEIQYFSGWNPQDIESWVLGQQSLDNPTMTIGERNEFVSAAAGASAQLFGTPSGTVDPRMVDILDGHFNPNVKPPASPSWFGASGSVGPSGSTASSGPTGSSALSLVAGTSSK